MLLAIFASRRIVVSELQVIRPERFGDDKPSFEDLSILSERIGDLAQIKVGRAANPRLRDKLP